MLPGRTALWHNLYLDWVADLCLAGGTRGRAGSECTKLLYLVDPKSSICPYVGVDYKLRIDRKYLAPRERTRSTVNGMAL
jgi:hypothetical protein